MPELEIPISTFFKTAQPSAATVPHLITYFDPELLQAVVRINGAKLGAWPLFAPFNEEDRYDTAREDVPLSAWGLPLNQQELLTLGMNVNSLIFDGNTLIVDSSIDEAALQECESARGENGYEDLPDFPSLVAQTRWALVPVGQNRDYALFVTSREKIDYFNLLANWCHERGRMYLMFAEKDSGLVLRGYPAPEDARKTAAAQYGGEFLTKVAHFGISPGEALKYLVESLKQQAQPANAGDAYQEKASSLYPGIPGVS